MVQSLFSQLRRARLPDELFAIWAQLKAHGEYAPVAAQEPVFQELLHAAPLTESRSMVVRDVLQDMSHAKVEITGALFQAVLVGLGTDFLAVRLYFQAAINMEPPMGPSTHANGLQTMFQLLLKQPDQWPDDLPGPYDLLSEVPPRILCVVCVCACLRACVCVSKAPLPTAFWTQACVCVCICMLVYVSPSVCDPHCRPGARTSQFVWVCG